MRNWWDQRSQRNQSYRPPLPGAAKQANWKWRGTGVQSYTHNADAAAYVAQCRQREIEKMRAKAERKAVQDLIERSKTLALPSGKTDSQKLHYAYSNIPYQRRLGV